MQRRARILATIGPASADAAVLSQLIEAGVDVFRLNFSHGDLDWHGQLIDRLHQLRRESGVPFGVLQDLPGPKMRTGKFPGGGVDLEQGATVLLTSREVEGSAELIPVNYPWLEEDVPTGSRVLLDDGNLEMMVGPRDADGLRATVVRGGTLRDHKGVNVPSATLRWQSLTDRDREVLRFGLAQGVDLVALSFVRHADDAAPVRAVMDEAGRRVPLVAKIEKPQALEQLAGIVDQFDAIMVARGDLGVELDPEQVPAAQKRIIAACRAAAKPVITATQMLESMTTNARPTRAEASDVANAVLDGSDAVMLSSETSVGQYPVIAVQTMDRIIRVAEGIQRPAVEGSPAGSDPVAALAHAGCVLADDLNATVMAVVTQTGRAPRAVSTLRPRTPVVVFTDEADTAHQLALWWGLRTELVDLPDGFDATSPVINARLAERGYARPGDGIVVGGATVMNGTIVNFIKYDLLPGGPAGQVNGGTQG
jgi:pyruvate kinase